MQQASCVPSFLSCVCVVFFCYPTTRPCKSLPCPALPLSLIYYCCFQICMCFLNFPGILQYKVLRVYMCTLKILPSQPDNYVGVSTAYELASISLNALKASGKLEMVGEVALVGQKATQYTLISHRPSVPCCFLSLLLLPNHHSSANSSSSSVSPSAAITVETETELEMK